MRLDSLHHFFSTKMTRIQVNIQNSIGVKKERKYFRFGDISQVYKFVTKKCLIKHEFRVFNLQRMLWMETVFAASIIKRCNACNYDN